MTSWYPQNKDELEIELNNLLKSKIKPKEEIHGLIVPHAGYIYSGKISGKAFSLLKEKIPDKAIILGPSHYESFFGLMSLSKIKTPLGEIKPDNELKLKRLDYEHSIENQIPFLQKLNPKIKITPIVVGGITNEEAERIAKEISRIKGVYIFSTDLSHFLPYDKAVKKDKKTTNIIENIDFPDINKIDACGKFPLNILMHLCRINNWKPKLIEYKNSGDITKEKNSVVGYSSFWF
jgi:hypothetical protein